MKRLLKLILISIVVAANSASASTISLFFSGSVAYATDFIAADLLFLAPVGSAVTGEIIIDTSVPRAPHSGGNDPNHYAQYYDAILSVDLALHSGDQVQLTAPDGVSLSDWISIHNDNPRAVKSGVEGFDAFALQIGPQSIDYWQAPEIAGYDLMGLSLSIYDDSEAMLTSLEIPVADLLNGGDGSIRSMHLNYGERLRANAYLVTGSLYIEDLSFSTVSAVPIPATAWLFGSALAGLFGLGRMRKQAA